MHFCRKQRLHSSKKKLPSDVLLSQTGAFLIQFSIPEDPDSQGLNESAGRHNLPFSRVILQASLIKLPAFSKYSSQFGELLCPAYDSPFCLFLPLSAG